MRKLTHEEILTSRRKNQLLDRSPISFLLDDVRSFYNVGSIFRIADGIRAEKVYLCGITGKPPARAITKTALGAEASVPWEYHADTLQLARQLKESGRQLIVMEHTDESITYLQLKPSFPVCLIVGNEVCGVRPELVQLADSACEIPMGGTKNSLNVAVAAGIAAYDLFLKALPFEEPFDFTSNHLTLRRF